MFKRRISIIAVLVVAVVSTWALGRIGGDGTPREELAAAVPERAPAAESAQKSAPAAGTGARFEVVSDGSEARYRVREQFVNVSFPVDAVGSTRSIEGVVLFDEAGRLVAGASSIHIDMSSLRSDQSRRDNFLRSNTLQTHRYPQAVFAPVEVKGLPSPLPAEGTAEIAIAGDLTIRDVTRRVEWTGTAHFRPDGMRVEAEDVITFAQFQLEKPQVGMILSVADEIRLEAEIDFRRVS